jgi:hypothetical protein
MNIEGVELFLLDRLNEKLTKELKVELFDTKLLSNSNFSSAKGFFDIKSLSRIQNIVEKMNHLFHE